MIIRGCTVSNFGDTLNSELIRLISGITPTIVNNSFKNTNTDFLRSLSDKIRAESKKTTILFLVNIIDKNASIILSSTNDYDLSNLFISIKNQFNLKGGGGKQLIQIGGVELEKIGEILNYTKNVIIKDEEK